MANHKSSIKRIRQINARRLHNRYYARTTRNAVRNFRALTDRAEAEVMLPKVASMLDRLAKKNIIHKNKAANLKSKLAKSLNRLGQA
ncbi:30S ribosomal protein S20 [Porphyromonas macacae]|uniref:Small ribosomal subunit protein bS20 n=1 Tax=Porphyromonas macacae TaxID=28115 RepID=A0A0A2EAB4_9PORP|nr:30S ribosomal protein S20 [Porphyromonas macacae]KGN74375.1 30S ribosomal protein S20 [Porphyromonas macacae]KGN99432.1 30S ribosomal protein S20 [Porphyromonas macacae]SUB77586.1 30S ribosomal protein S20 [Porphyromonas macacae]SUB88762.1 30S ribosomal protein S20 [Porphyromonas macacae]